MFLLFLIFHFLLNSTKIKFLLIFLITIELQQKHFAKSDFFGNAKFLIKIFLLVLVFEKNMNFKIYLN